MKRIIGSRAVVVPAAMALQPAATHAESVKAGKPDFSNNFGFPLSFDVSKMDSKASPRQDFSRVNVRDWWAPEDTKAFLERSRNLVAQAAAYEVVPGTHLNGELSSGENLADIGGLALAYDALNRYLKANPRGDRRIDGMTPQQCCFAAWAQNWADKKQPGMLKQEALTDGHPPGVYRMFAPAQNVAGLYETYGIKPGDRMWLDPKDRVSIW